MRGWASAGRAQITGRAGHARNDIAFYPLARDGAAHGEKAVKRAAHGAQRPEIRVLAHLFAQVMVRTFKAQKEWGLAGGAAGAEDGVDSGDLGHLLQRSCRGDTVYLTGCPGDGDNNWHLSNPQSCFAPFAASVSCKQSARSGPVYTSLQPTQIKNFFSRMTRAAGLFRLTAGHISVIQNTTYTAMEEA